MLGVCSGSNSGGLVSVTSVVICVGSVDVVVDGGDSCGGAGGARRAFLFVLGLSELGPVFILKKINQIRHLFYNKKVC